MIRPVNDYRIGNFVLDEDGELCKIEQLSSSKMGVSQQVSPLENKSCLSSKYPSNIYAIPLTEEWVLNLGFKARKSVFGYWVYEIEFMNTTYSVEEIDLGLCYFYSDNAVVSQTKNVHELQNLYFCITGEELLFSTEP